MIVRASSDYYINELKQNPVNTNKYFYVDSFDGSLTIKNNKWFLDLNYYVISNSYLPINLFECNINLPFAWIGDLTLIRDYTAQIPSWVYQKDMCQVYKTSYALDVSDSAFLNNKLTDFNMYTMLSFAVNLDVFNNTDIKVSTGGRDHFISEVNNSKLQTNFYYSNFTSVQDTKGFLDDCNAYYLNSQTGSYSTFTPIYYDLGKDYDLLKTPITSLITLNTEQPILINGYKIKFYYEIEGTHNAKVLEAQSSERIYLSGPTALRFDQFTFYDPAKQEVSIALNGTLGFFIPTKAIGYYELQIQTWQDNNIRNYVFIKSFSFCGNAISNFNLIAQQMYINRLNNFKRMVF